MSDVTRVCEEKEKHCQHVLQVCWVQSNTSWKFCTKCCEWVVTDVSKDAGSLAFKS